jgi:Domain of unknown function (DUF4268)/Helicase conserved C-terminal domain
VTRTLDLGRIYRDLKDFQLATVDHVAERLYGADATTRFLVADEVGLGKTLVARGLIARTIEHHLRQDTGRIDIVYICSNADIARQNIGRLNVLGAADFDLATRITLLPQILSDLQRNRINFVSFTPGTSFDLRSSEGRREERELLYRMLRRLWGSGVVRAYPRDTKVFAGGAGYDNFHNRIKRGDDTFDITLAEEFNGKLEALDEARPTGTPSMQERFEHLRDRLARVPDPSRVPHDVRSDRAAFIGTLRDVLARSCVQALEPDLVILDEFQRFKHIFDDTDPAGELARELFDYEDVRVVLLSATPYKMYTLTDEPDDDHYADFLGTLDFLVGEERSGELAEQVRAYRRALFDVSASALAVARITKERLEASLRRCMTRTERLAVTADRSGMLAEQPCQDLRLDADDVRRYVALARLADEVEVGGALAYWQATPYPLSFMDGYELDRRVERRLEDPLTNGELEHLDADQLALSRADVEAYERLDPANSRLRWLLSELIDNGAWRLLWVPPSLPYHELGGAYADPQLAGFTKKLVFSAWKVVPTVVGAMLSYAAERRMVQAGDPAAVNTAEARQRFTGLLRFQRSEGRLTGMPVFALLYPSPALAELGDPRKVAHQLGGDGVPPSRDDVLHVVRERIAARLAPHTEGTPDDGPEDETWYWAAPLLLDRDRNPEGTAAWFDRWDLAERFTALGDGTSSDAAPDGWREHVEEAVAFVRAPSSLGRVPHDLVDVAAELALGGPGVLALRSLARINEAGVDDSATRAHAGFVAWGLRHMFNLLDVTSLLRAGVEGRQREDAYWRLVLRHCIDGCLQAVLDEHAHVVREWLGLTAVRGEALLGPVSETIGEALTMRTVNYSVRHFEQRNGHVAVRKGRMRGLLALRFGDKDTDDERNLQRSSTVRKAFNSPFRPFVLATTSVGQEGLDFHTWCHAVVHWNLPGNPVDLEQREGRVHRYKGHAVRRNVAVNQRSAAFNDDPDPWTAMFDAAAGERRDDESELVPYWVYAPDGGAQIERYVPALPLSRDARQLADLKRSMAAYRLVFGQPRQEDLVAFLKDRLDDAELAALMTDLRIDVTPPPLSDARRAELCSAAPLEIPMEEGADASALTDAERRRQRYAKRGDRYQRFWSTVLADIRRSMPDVYVPAPPPRSWVWMPSGIPRIGFALAFASRDRLRIELYVDAKDAEAQRARWRHFVAARGDIEARFGQSLVWEELPDSRASRIAHYFPGAASVVDEQQWPALRQWLIDVAAPFERAVQPSVDALGS